MLIGLFFFYTLEKSGIIFLLPATTHCGDGLKAARGQLVRAGEAAIHCPIKQVWLIWVQFQQKNDHLTAQSMHLKQHVLIDFILVFIDIH